MKSVGNERCSFLYCSCVTLLILFSQGLLFNPTKPFSRGAGCQSADVDLMIDCFVSCYRVNPRNNQHFKVSSVKIVSRMLQSHYSK